MSAGLSCLLPSVAVALCGGFCGGCERFAGAVVGLAGLAAWAVLRASCGACTACRALAAIPVFDGLAWRL